MLFANFKSTHKLQIASVRREMCQLGAQKDGSFTHNLTVALDMNTEGRQFYQRAPGIRRFWLWRRLHIIPGVEHDAVMSNVVDGGGFTPRYAFMVVMSCGIAILGLLQSSAAVVIGAMLISPLMGPIVQLGFSLCVVDFRLMRRALYALAMGVALALLTAMSVVWLSPLKEATSEILARTQPNLFDLLVALFSGLAGGYAVITRKGEAIVGVAIATALMPPLAVVGFGLATSNMAIAGGAFFLFMTNLLAIAFSVTLIAKWYGFGVENSPQHTAWQAGVIAATFILLAIPLGLALRDIAERTWTANQTRVAIQSYLGEHGGSIEQLKIERSNNHYAINLVALVPNYLGDAQANIQKRLAMRLKRGFTVQVRQMLEANDNLLRNRVDLDDLRVHMDDLTQQVAELRKQSQSLIALQVKDLLKGQSSDVSVDIDQKKISVTLEPASDLSERDIQALKAKLAESEPGWNVDINKLSLTDSAHDQQAREPGPMSARR
jgi:uncharacterized hydrophobic protein (TIGR00271 family)